MSRYDYCESLERRIEKLERELYRKDELFGLGSKNRGVTISNGKNLMKMLKSSIQPDLRKYLSYEAGVNDFNIDFKANDNVVSFWFRDSKDNDGMTNVRCASRNRNFEEKTFDITDKTDIEDICDWMEERIIRAYDGYRAQNERLKGKNMIKIKLESDYDIRYYDGYNKFNAPRVRDNQYNPMIVGEREELFNNILDSIDKKQSSPKYDHIFYIEGTNVDVGGGVEYPGMYNHVDDDYTKVNIICELLDKNSGKTLDSFEKNLIIDYSDFMDSYGIESDIEDYILDELRKYMMRTLEQYDPKYRKI